MPVLTREEDTSPLYASNNPGEESSPRYAVIAQERGVIASWCPSCSSSCYPGGVPPAPPPATRWYILLLLYPVVYPAPAVPGGVHALPATRWCTCSSCYPSGISSSRYPSGISLFPLPGWCTGPPAVPGWCTGPPAVPGWYTSFFSLLPRVVYLLLLSVTRVVYPHPYCCIGWWSLIPPAVPGGGPSCSSRYPGGGPSCSSRYPGGISLLLLLMYPGGYIPAAPAVGRPSRPSSQCRFGFLLLPAKMIKTALSAPFARFFP